MKGEDWKKAYEEDPEYFEELDEGEDDSDEMQRTRMRHRLLRNVEKDLHQDEEAKSWKKALAQQYPSRYRKNGD